MKKALAVLTFVVMALVAVQIVDFVVAPETTMGYVKSRIGANVLLQQIKQEFTKNGTHGVKKLCQQYPVEKLGFHYVCLVSDSSISSAEGHFRNIDAIVLIFNNKDAALDATTGLLTWDPIEEEKFGEAAYASAMKHIKRLVTPVASTYATLLNVRVD